MRIVNSPIFFLTRLLATIIASSGALVVLAIGLVVLAATEGVWFSMSVMLASLWAHIEYTYFIYRKRRELYRATFRTLAVIEIILEWLFGFFVHRHVLIVEWDEDEDEFTLPSIAEIFSDHDDDVFITIKTTRYHIRLNKD